MTAAARSIPPGSWQLTALWAVVKWAADFAVLVSATLAVGADVDVIALATVYLGIQVLRQIPLTPGGVGIIEAALLAGLIAAGAAATPAAAAVVIYRLLTFWLILPAGGVAALLARRTDRIPPAVSAATVLP
ncbi:MAG TPA: flippase-like domain-containing protein [Nakamurella sp.]